MIIDGENNSDRSGTIFAGAIGITWPGGSAGLVRIQLKRRSMNNRRLASTVSHFLHEHFLWFLQCDTTHHLLQPHVTFDRWWHHNPPPGRTGLREGEAA
jgi:hypothetical protein